MKQFLGKSLASLLIVFGSPSGFAGDATNNPTNVGCIRSLIQRVWSPVQTHVGEYIVLKLSRHQSDWAKLYLDKKGTPTVVQVLKQNTDGSIIVRYGETELPVKRGQLRPFRQIVAATDPQEYFKSHLQLQNYLRLNTPAGPVFVSGIGLSSEVAHTIAKNVQRTYQDILSLETRLGIPAQRANLEIVISTDLPTCMTRPEHIVNRRHKVIQIDPSYDGKTNVLVINPTEFSPEKGVVDSMFDFVIAHEVGHIRDPMTTAHYAAFLKDIDETAMFYTPDPLLEAFADYTAYVVTGKTTTDNLGRDMAQPRVRSSTEFFEKTPKEAFEHFVQTHNLGEIYAHAFFELSKIYGKDSLWKIFYAIRREGYPGIKALVEPVRSYGKAEIEIAARATFAIERFLDRYFSQHHPEMHKEFMRLIGRLPSKRIVNRDQSDIIHLQGKEHHDTQILTVLAGGIHWAPLWTVRMFGIFA